MGQEVKGRRSVGPWSCSFLLWLCVVLLQFGLSAPVSAATTKNHVFNAALSLTGGTGVSKADPIPDPPPNHPSEPFYIPCGVAVDEAGDTYVASFGQGESGRIDVFGPSGLFLTEISNPNHPCSLAVDAEGNLYVSEQETGEVVRYSPNAYPPSPSVSYGSPTTINSGFLDRGLAIDRTTQHLFVADYEHVIEFSSAAEGNKVIRSDIGEGVLNNARGIAVDGSTGKIYVGSVCAGCNPIPSAENPHVSVIYVFDSSGALVETVTGADIPGSEGFESAFGHLFPAIDEESGELFVNDVEGSQRVYRFVRNEGSFEYLADPELEEHSYIELSRIAVADGPASPNAGNVYVTSSSQPIGHMFAFEPEGEVLPPSVSKASVSGITSTEAFAEAEINPNGAQVEYRFEYVTDEEYEANVAAFGQEQGFVNAATVGSGTLLVSNQLSTVFAALSGLTPGTTYHVRVVASSSCDEEHTEQLCVTEGAESVFATYPSSPTPAPCSNAQFRIGPSAGLPDCRAYELVSPPNTNGRQPSASTIGNGTGNFRTELANPSGESLLYMTIAGALPGTEGNGVGDGYEASRTPSGWSTHTVGPTGAQSQAPSPGGASAEHGYWFWDTGTETDHGSLVIGGKSTHYVRTPSGDFSLVGTGPLATDPAAQGRWISPSGEHLIFTSKRALTAESPPDGVEGIYDRASDGTVHVVSLKPSGEPLGGEADVEYLGTSADGSAVCFTVTEGGLTTVFEHRADLGTVPVAAGAITFAGLSSNGDRLTYLKEGNLFSFDALTQQTQAIGSGGKEVAVNVAADGSHVYFVSPKVLALGGAHAGEENFYVWSAATDSISFIAELDPVDVTGVQQAQVKTYGLGLWTKGVGPSQDALTGVADDPSRTTPNGEVIAFESRANLTGYKAEGHVEVYRYEGGSSPRLTCLSCNPTLAAPSSDAHLQVLWAADPAAPTGGLTPIHNLSDDGQRVFFQTGDPLVRSDVDQTQDVYEWVAQGTGGCSRSGGCVVLISSGQSASPNFLYGASADGSDVFFATSDLLVPADKDTTRSLYDARVDGGFPEPVTPPCSGEACRPLPGSSPVAPSIATQAAGGAGGRAHKHCNKGQRRVRRHGRVHCIADHPRHRHSHRKRGRS